jgi:UMF1 family MFS transporter
LLLIFNPRPPLSGFRHLVSYFCSLPIFRTSALQSFHGTLSDSDGTMDQSTDTSRNRKAVISWAFYDWANSAFATTVMAGFFPIFFKQYWSTGIDVHRSTFILGTANSLAGLAVALLAPILGSIADTGHVRKRFLFFFASMGVLWTAGLGLVEEGRWAFAALLYAIACVGFLGGNIFYDSLLVNVAEKDKMDMVSSLGYSLGYLGGGILFALNVVMVLNPALFGLRSSAQAVRLSFVSVALWWAVFSIPILLFVKEPGTPRARGYGATIREGFRELTRTLREIRKLRDVFLFLLAYWLYIDGVDTIILMAIDYGLSIGLDSTGLIKALLITQFVGFPAAIVFGKIGERLGTKTGIYSGIVVYLAVTVWGYFMNTQLEFYVLAIAIGLVQGGVQSLSRAFYGKLIPKERAGEFFGFYNMLGRFAAVIGPALMGWVSVLTGNPRYPIFAVTALFLGGAALLRCVRDAGRD